MVVLGLTGSIGMGKSRVAKAFAREGAAVFDADATVHALLAPGGEGVPAVGEVFPEAVRESPRGPWADRTVLARKVFANGGDLARLEAILHPLAGRAKARFLRQASARRRHLAVLDIPLLFETGSERYCDAVAVVTAPKFVQTQRVLARPSMTLNRLAGIRRRQMSEAEKIRRATYVIRTGISIRAGLRAVRGIAQQLNRRGGGKWPPKGAVLTRN